MSTAPPRSRAPARFFFHDRPECPVKAAGILLRRTINGRPQFLIQVRRYDNDGTWRPKWLSADECKQRDHLNIIEDFGGKVDHGDDSFVDTMIREAVEESNGLISETSLRTRLGSPDTQFFYQPRSSYVVALIEATDEESCMTGEEFGTREHHDEWLVERRVQWVNAGFLHKRWKQLHCRLQLRPLFAK